ncbi:MAG: HEPN domain-containing protein [Armatimonadetes bacterium]|nr:HEPN domain-containing protein [Armatimonadota bacterium]
MTNREMAEGLFRLGEGRLEVLPAFLERGNFPTVIREAQECVELVLKAALRYVGIEPARTHDVAPLLRAHDDRFPAWFKEHIERLAVISTDLADRRGLSFYGDEERGVPPDRLFSRADAEAAIEQARFVHRLCRRLLVGDSALQG